MHADFRGSGAQINVYPRAASLRPEICSGLFGNNSTEDAKSTCSLHNSFQRIGHTGCRLAVHAVGVIGHETLLSRQ